VPERLAESTVIVVPSLRPTENGPVAGAMRALAALVDSTADPERVPVAATRVIEPAVSVLDATTAYGGDPAGKRAVRGFGFRRRRRRVLAARPIARDRRGAEDGPRGRRTGHRRGDGVDFERLRERIPDGELPPSDETHPAVSTAYRVYAAVAGDAVPPQLEGGR